MAEHGWRRTLELSASEKQVEVDSVLASETFARSEQLRSFLKYVCQMEMEGRAAELNEYLVGVEALGRPSSYSPAEDSSVRSRAWELRQKLLKHYSSQRTHSEVRIDLPRGGYAPQYLVRDQSPDQEERKSGDNAEPAALSKTVTLSHTIARYALMTVLAALAGALGVTGANHFWKSPLTDSVDPVIRQAWGPLLAPGASDIIVMANGLYFIIRPEGTPGGHDRRQFPVPPEVYSEYRERRPLDPDTRLTMFTQENVVLMGYINGLVTITGFLQQSNVSFYLSPERIVPTYAIRNRNAILFGAPQDSIMISDVLRKGVFHFGYSPKHDIVIQKGDASFDDAPYYVSRIRDLANSFETYGVITVMQSIGAESPETRTVVFSGITSVGAQAAAEFFASPAHMRDLRERFRKEGLNDFPPAYQVVLRCNARDTLLVSYEYADSAILP